MQRTLQHMLCNTKMCHTYIYCTLRGRIKGATSAISIIQHSLRGGARNTAWHVITVIVVAFLTQENKAGKKQSTINQLKHGKDVLYAIMVLAWFVDVFFLHVLYDASVYYQYISMVPIITRALAEVGGQVRWSKHLYRLHLIVV